MPLLSPPARIDDFAHSRDPQGAAQRYNDKVIGRYVSAAVGSSKNFFSPLELTAGAPVAGVPWNGFPKSIDRWMDVVTHVGDLSKVEAAEAVADVLRPQAYVVIDTQDGPDLVQVNLDAVSHYRKDDARSQARPLRTASGKNVTIRIRQQDEYLEWFAKRNGIGAIEHIDFTAEPYDYWQFLASEDIDLVTSLYQLHIDGGITKPELQFQEDILVWYPSQNGWAKLYDKGDYNPYNEWNTTHGAMHLTHPANSLGAEVNLAGGASVVWDSDGKPPDPVFDNDRATMRIACAGYGDINRSSDPSIGNGVGLQVAAGNRVTLVDPVGLYIRDIDLSSLSDRNGVPITNALSVKRQDASDPNNPRILRARIGLPENSALKLSDCLLDNRPLTRGGQIARATTMTIYASVVAGNVDRGSSACKNLLYCKHPVHRSFYGNWGKNQIAKCTDVTDEDWKTQGHLESAIGDATGLVLDAEPANDVVVKAEVPRSAFSFKRKTS
ncbi:hypothetical protein RAD15_24430 [Bradyrhizobium sp. 14AA]